MDGVIPLFKPKGMTSHDCVARLRKLLQKKKMGHTGTLDPGVEGVLPICVGEATKIIPFLTPLKKVYIADVALGTSTTTEDAEGEVVEEKKVDVPPSDEEIENVLQTFVGQVNQVPPMYSAVKIKGKKLYEYARDNIEVERPKRTITIYKLQRIKNELNESKNSFRIKVTCSKGTYIRTLCVDIGAQLRYPAHMAYLQRIETDSIKLEETVTFEEINEAQAQGNLNGILIPIGNLLSHFESWQVDAQTKRKILHGQKLPFPAELTTNIFKVMHQNELLAIYERHEENENEMKPVRVFNMYKV